MAPAVCAVHSICDGAFAIGRLPGLHAIHSGPALRIQPGKIIDQVANGQEVTVTFRGKALAKIVPIHKEDSVSTQEDNGFFGMWNKRKEAKTVEEAVRELRKGRAPGMGVVELP